MNSGLVAINFAAVIFGTAALFGKLHISPFWIVAARGAFAALTLLIYGKLRGRLDVKIPQAARAKVVATGILLTIHWLTFFASVQLSGVAVATLTFAAFPFFTTLFQAIKLRRKPQPLEVLASVVIIGAVALLVDFKNENANYVGAVAGLGSALSFAAFGIFSKHLTRQLSPLTLSIAQNSIVALLLLPCLVFARPIPTAITDWFWLLALGVVTTALMHQLYLFALTRLSASTCSGFVALEPVYAIGFTALFLHEPVTIWIAVSGGLILAASILLLKSEDQVPLR